MLLSTALRARQFVHDRVLSYRSMEPVYQHLFERRISDLGITRRFYPIGAAANYSLLYLILRSILECPIKTVTEFGVGQSTLLLAALREIRTDLQVTSYEADEGWAERIRSEVDCDIRVCPMTTYRVAGRAVPFYQIAPDTRPSDMVIVDGPVGADSVGRLGCLAVVPDLVGSDFLVILDDTNRAPEMLTSNQLHDVLAARAGETGSSFVRAAKWQRVIASGRHRHAIYF